MGNGKMNGTNMIDINNADTQGIWELLPCDSQILAVHAAILHTGKVLFISGSGNSVPKHNAHEFHSIVWDYQNGTFKLLTTPTDIFCSGHSFLDDGRLLVAGGTLDYQSGNDQDGTLRGFRGTRTAYLFDPTIEDFVRVADMEDGRRYQNDDGRWYPTLVALHDDRTLTISGLSATLLPPNNIGNQYSRINDLNEVYSESDGWTSNGILRSNIRDATWPLYPHLYLTNKSHQMFYSGAHVFGSNNLPPGWLDLSNNTFSPLNMTPAQADSFDLNRRDQSASVLLPPAQEQKVMVMGGGGLKDLGRPPGPTNPEIGIAKVHIVDLKNANPTYHQVASMHFPRMHLNAVLLPDRTVLVSGGEAVVEDKDQAALSAEIYNPSSNTWKVAAKAIVPRMYHSIAILLPDARVITAGSNPESADPGGGDLRLELFHPPYLFKGPRPLIQNAPQEWTYGETIRIHTPHAKDIKWINLIRPMATTHSWDSNQRLVDVKFIHDKTCQLVAQVPRESSLAPPGWYMLFITNGKDVPSVAHWVHIIDENKE